jgi:hypothetical protein
MDNPITTKSMDYNNSVIVAFRFQNVYTGFQAPNDITPEEMAKTLELTAINIREGKNVIVVPTRYAQERREYIRRVQQEEARENG